MVNKNPDIEQKYNSNYQFGVVNNILILGRIDCMITFERAAEIAFYSLLPEDREEVESTIEQLAHYVEDPTSDPGVQKLDASFDYLEDLFMIQANSELRILFRHADHSIEVVDILPFSRLEGMHTQAV